MDGFTSFPIDPAAPSPATESASAPPPQETPAPRPAPQDTVTISAESASAARTASAGAVEGANGPVAAEGRSEDQMEEFVARIQASLAEAAQRYAAATPAGTEPTESLIAEA